MFEAYQPNLENMQQYLNNENNKSSGDGPNWWSIPAGMSIVRILPPWDPTGRVALPVFMHPIEFKGADMAFTKYNWTCVNKTFNKPCAICEGLANLAASGVDISKWDATRKQYYFNAIVLRDPTFNGKDKGTAPGTHVLMKAPKTFYDWVISQITNEFVGDITSVANGIDICITKEGTGLGTTYNMTLSPSGRTAVPEEYLKEIKSLYDIDSVFSAGFDQKQIDELVEHLKKSAGVIANTVSGTINQMAGYQSGVAYNPAPTPVTQPAMAPNPNQFAAPQQQFAAPSPFQQSIPTPAPQQFAVPPVAPYGAPAGPEYNIPAPIPTSAPADNLPKCYGQYDSGNVNCVVCPHEINCSKSK